MLRKWGPKLGCSDRIASDRIYWVRAVGIPAHMWDMKIFGEIGMVCGELLEVDPLTVRCMHYQWARLKIKLINREFPKSAKVSDGK